jgi:uncharacterized protein YegJ (DUF2314 family)
MWGVFAVFAAPIPGLLLRMRWARLAGIALLSWLLVNRAYGLVTREFKWNSLWHAGALGFIAYGLWKKPDSGIMDESVEEEGVETEKEESKPIISLVHLRCQQRYLEAQVLANALSEAWGLNIVGGEVARTMPNRRFAEIIRDHGSWLAVDLMEAMDTKMAHDEAYRMIGKAISALADDDVMAIMCPQHQFFNLWSPALESMLCGDSPLDALREEVKAPVFGVPDGDAIQHAIAEARRRWPEFATAFKNRLPDDDRFLVKAPFTGENDQTEHMWLQVFGLEPEYVHGHLMNDPLHPTKLKKGSQVEVPVAEISDWICPDAKDEALGNFTHQAVLQAAKQQNEA